MKTFVKILCVVIALLAIGGLVFFFYFSFDTNGGMKTFTVVYKGQEITTEKTGITLPKGETNIFECKSIVQNKGYTVNIMPSAGATFDYTVDGAILAYSKVGDITEYFGVKENKQYFTLFMPKDFTMQTLLERKHPNKVVVIPKLEDKDYYCIIVTTADKQKMIRISFH